MNVLDSLWRQSGLAPCVFPKIVIKALNGMCVQRFQLYGPHGWLYVVLDVLGVVQHSERLHAA